MEQAKVLNLDENVYNTVIISNNALIISPWKSSPGFFIKCYIGLY
jgi:hypothetical protein